MGYAVLPPARIEEASNSKAVCLPGGSDDRDPRHQDSPEPEPPTSSGDRKLSRQSVEARLTEGAEDQLKRYDRIEESISILSARLDALLQASEVKLDQGRLEGLEDKVLGLASLLAPILDVEGDWLPQHQRRRPPSPPRALMGPAAPTLPRARTQGLGSG